MSGNGKPEVVPESKLMATRRWRKEGRENEATLFRHEVLKELREAGFFGVEARETAWSEAIRMFPALPVPEPTKKEKKRTMNEDRTEEIPEEIPPEIAEADAEAIEKMLEKLPPVDLFADIRWVYSQLENKRVRADQAPSAGAWSLLSWARKYQSRFFEQLLPKALAKGPEDEVDVKREKKRIEEIEAAISTVSEDE